MAYKTNKIELTQTTIEATGYKILDMFERLVNEKNAINIQSKAFDMKAPNGNTIEVQIIVTRAVFDFLPDGIDMLKLYRAE